jgi:hypothetical protein
VPLRIAFSKRNSHPTGRLFFLEKAQLGSALHSNSSPLASGFLCCFCGLFLRKKAPSSSKKPLAKGLSFPFSPSRFWARVFLISYG